MSLHNPISPLHAYYVQKVLPAVYDDSLSYYEILCKVQETLNEVVSTTNEQSVVVLEMQQAINDFIHGGYTDTFEEYLDEWFEENSDAFVQRLIEEGIIPEVSDIQSDLETVHRNLAALEATDTELTAKKVPYPLAGAMPSYGTSGQVLSTNADGTTRWQEPVNPSDEQAEQYISQWLSAHPEATTTVQDGAITTAKLANGAVTDAKLAQSGGVLTAVEEINDRFLVSTGANLLNESASEDGYITSDGTLQIREDWKTTPYIYVGDVAHVWSSATEISNNNRTYLPMYFLSYYDNSKQFIEQLLEYTSNIEIPSNVAYIRYSYHAELFNKLTLRSEQSNNFAQYVEYYNLKNSEYVGKDYVDSEIKTSITSFAYIKYELASYEILQDKMLLANGSIIDYANYFVTDYVDVSDVDSIEITCSTNYGNGLIAFYDESRGFMTTPLIANQGVAVTTYVNYQINVPTQAKYVVVAGYSNVLPSVKLQSGYTLKKWNGINWVVFGDSLTDNRNTRATKRYYDYVSEVTGINIINAGVSGSGYCKNGETVFGPNTNWRDRILTLENVDFDVITLFGSFNDLGTGLPNGNITDSTPETKAGCINITLDNLFSVKPLANVGIVTPTPWQYARPGESSADSYVQLLIDIANRRSIPLLDLFHASLLRPWDAEFRELAYSNDNGGGTHPDNTGNKIMAPRFEGFLNTLLLD